MDILSFLATESLDSTDNDDLLLMHLKPVFQLPDPLKDYSEQQNRSSVGHFHKDCFVVLGILKLNFWNLKDMYFDILSFN